jgi:hypothetical protein
MMWMDMEASVLDLISGGIPARTEKKHTKQNLDGFMDDI